MRRLRERQRGHSFIVAFQRAIDARRNEPRPAWVRPDLTQREYEDSLRARAQDSPTLLAFLFAPPDSDAIAQLDARGKYFHVRTGDTWDLFFPGYYRSRRDVGFESQKGAHPIGSSYASKWYFSAKDFDGLRGHIEDSSERRWEYSGEVDLVLINAWLTNHDEPTIDWASTISGQISDRMAGVQTLTLGNVIEKITRDLETAAEDKFYGVGQVTDGPPPSASHVGRDFMIQALSGIAAALGAKALGG